MGVTDSLKTQATPLEREHAVSFDKLLEQIASGRSDEDAVATLAGRLARLDRHLDDTARAKIEAIAGRPLTALAGELVDAIDAERIEAAAQGEARSTPTDAQTEAVQPRSGRRCSLPMTTPNCVTCWWISKKASEVVIDEINTDVVISSPGLRSRRRR